MSTLEAKKVILVELLVLWEENYEQQRERENQVPTTCPGLSRKRLDNIAFYSVNEMLRIPSSINVESGDTS